MTPTAWTAVIALVVLLALAGWALLSLFGQLDAEREARRRAERMYAGALDELRAEKRRHADTLMRLAAKALRREEAA